MKKYLFLLLLTGFTRTKVQAGIPADSIAFQYKTAFAHIEAMLSGAAPASYEEAIYQVENAWYGGRLDHTAFTAALDFHQANIERIIAGSGNDSIKNRPGDDLETADEKRQRYEQVLANYGIYTYLTTGSFFINQGKIVYHDPYTYSNGDPMGTEDWRNTQVTHLLDAHSGNCFALASLFLIFSERLHSNASLCTAPSHIWIRHGDENGNSANVELSKRAFPGTGTLETITYTPTAAVRSGISMRTLNLKQAIGLCLVYLAKGYEQRTGDKTAPFIIECAETALRYDNLNLNAMLLKTEVLESRLTANGSIRDLKILKAKPEFAGYEVYVGQLFRFGYLEMPYQMKNLLVQGWKKDTLLRLQQQVYCSSTEGPKHLPATPYASLSWGLFDEEMRVKPVERYGNTFFDTKTRKIVGFAQPDVLISQYSFDPVVFAWNVDPLAHKYPGISPYAFCYDNPISVMDPDGREGVVVTGQPGDHGNREHFLVNGLNRARELNKHFSESGSGEKATWLVYNGGGKGGYDPKTIEKYTALAAKHGVAMVVVNSSDQIVDYVNEKNGGDSRAKDQISNFFYIGHASPGDLDVGFVDHGRINMMMNDKIEPSDFDAAAFKSGCTIDVVGGCRTAVDGDLPFETSVIDQFAEKVDSRSRVRGSDVRVYYPGGVVQDQDLVKHNNGHVVEKSGTKE